MPDGTPRKLMDYSKINALGWKSIIILQDGIKRTILEVYNQL
jgi:GDP-L-fucose synthase